MEAAPASKVSSAMEPADLRRAVQMERWDEVLRRLESLPEVVSSEPRFRYLRARTLVELGRPAEARPLLEGLSASLPLLGTELGQLEVRLASELGPPGTVLHAWTQGKMPGAWVRLAQLALDVDARSLESAIEEVLRRAKSSQEPASEAQARALRWLRLPGHLVERGKDLAWLLARPERTVGALELDGAKLLLAKLDPADRLVLVQGLVDRGHADEALVQLDALEKGRWRDTPRLLELRGRALRALRRDAEAARTLERAIQRGAPGASELRLLEARSWLRAGELGRARQLLTALSGEGADPSLAARAGLTLARVLEQQGEVRAARQTYERVLRRQASTRKSSEEHRDAKAGLALLLLASLDEPAAARRARALLAELGQHATSEDAARWQELEGVAAWKGGHPTEAEALWTKVVRERPLTFAALAARLRLARAGLPLPALWASVEPQVLDLVPNGAPQLSERAALLQALGLDAEAELALREDESTWLAPGGGVAQRCATYGVLASARQRYREGVRGVDAAPLWRAPDGAHRSAWECLYPLP